MINLKENLKKNIINLLEKYDLYIDKQVLYVNKNDIIVSGKVREINININNKEYMEISCRKKENPRITIDIEHDDIYSIDWDINISEIYSSKKEIGKALLKKYNITLEELS